jgi:hypothetical protein
VDIMQPDLDEKEHTEIMDDEIEMEYKRGASTLFKGDKSLMEHNLISLLQKSLAYKKRVVKTDPSSTPKVLSEGSKRR